MQTETWEMREYKIEAGGQSAVWSGDRGPRDLAQTFARRLGLAEGQVVTVTHIKTGRVQTFTWRDGLAD